MSQNPYYPHLVLPKPSNPPPPPKPEGPIGQAPKRQSRLGIASLVLATLAGLTYVVTFSLFAIRVRQWKAPAHSMDQEFFMENFWFLRKLAMFDSGAFVLALVGCILGLIFCFRADRKKAIGIVGTVLNALILLGSIAMLIFGATKTHGP